MIIVSLQRIIPRKRHRQLHCVYGDVLFRQTAVGFPHYDRATHLPQLLSWTYEASRHTSTEIPRTESQ